MKATTVIIGILSITIASTALGNSVCQKAKKGQSKGLKEIKITGKIVDNETQLPLEYSTISLCSQVDSSIVFQSLSDTSGHFSIMTSDLPSFLKIEFLAYKAKIIELPSFSEKQNTIDIGTVSLEPNFELLNTVDIRAKKSTLLVQLDKRVFNVGQDLVAKGGTAEDILRNAPSVWVDIDGNITLRSGGQVLILLDGQSSLLLSGEQSEGLRQIPASAIDYIEIITNPSARYQADGTAGIINIVLKKGKKTGFNGAISANVGLPSNYGLGVYMNYKAQKINLFGAFGSWQINKVGDGTFRNRFYNTASPDSIVFSNMDRTHQRQSLPRQVKFGIDYYLNANNTLTTSFAYRGSNKHNTSQLIYQDAYGSADNVYLLTERLENEQETESSINYFLRHRLTFPKKGHQLTTDFRYEDNMEETFSIYDETYFDGENRLLDTVSFRQLTKNYSDYRQIILKSDYILPIKDKMKLELGFHNAFRSIRNDYSLNTIIDNVENIDTNFTNDFQYNEDVHSLYADFGNQLKNFSYLIGLRAEYTIAQTALTTSHTDNTQRYINLFPSLFFSYNLPNASAIQMSYSRRIERPTFWDLNPFFTFRDRRNIFRGNPNIQPEYTDAYEIGHIKYWDKATSSSILYYRQTDNVIKRIQRTDEAFPNVTITQAENLDFKRNYGIEFIYSCKPVKWWSMNGDVNFYHSLSEGTFEYKEQSYFVGGGSFSLKTQFTSQFTLWDVLNSQFTFTYEAPRTTTQGVNKAMYALDIASSMDVFNNKSSLTMSVRDVFNSRRRRSFSEDDTFYSEDNFLWQSRTFILSFHYRLNQHKQQRQIYSSPLNDEKEEQF